MEIIETNHLTRDNQEKFGMDVSQVQFISSILYQVEDVVHGYVLDNVFKDGYYNAKFKLTSNYAEKLIKCLIENIKFEFIEYDTPSWHKWKLESRTKKLIQGDY